MAGKDSYPLPRFQQRLANARSGQKAGPPARVPWPPTSAKALEGVKDQELHALGSPPPPPQHCHTLPSSPGAEGFPLEPPETLVGPGSKWPPLPAGKQLPPPPACVPACLRGEGGVLWPPPAMSLWPSVPRVPQAHRSQAFPGRGGAGGGGRLGSGKGLKTIQSTPSHGPNRHWSPSTPRAAVLGSGLLYG